MNPVILKLQKLIGLTKSEITIAMFIIAGLAAGAIIKSFSKGEQIYYSDISGEIYRQLDSTAEAYRSTLTGSDIYGKPDSKLASADTIVEKESLFPKSNKKSLSTEININVASVSELTKLPGIGLATAEKIISYRKEAQFEKPEDIMNIKGIGPKKFEKMKEFIIVK